MCIKAFTFIFSYINFLPIPWRLSIWMEAFFGRPMINDELQVGVDFYGRPTEALWFHLPRGDRRSITVLLNLAWVAHFASQASHLVYWSYAAAQGLEGMLAQNIPFLTSIIAGIGAGVLQGRAEATVRAANPGRFPPLQKEWVRAAIADASDRWREGVAGTGKRARSRCGCGSRWCSARFWRLLREEVREERGRYKEEMNSHGKQGKAHALTGIHGSCGSLGARKAAARGAA